MSDIAKIPDIRSVLIDSAGPSIDKLPMLQVIFERVATLCADSLRQFSTSQPYVSLNSVESGGIGDILQPYESKAVFGIFHATAWDTQVLVGFDRSFVFALVELFLGADGSEPPVEDERSFSTIEIRIAETLFEQVARALQASFASVSDATFRFERAETRMDFAVNGRRNTPVVASKFSLQAIDRSGEMFVVIPQAALTPMRQVLSRTASEEPRAGDPVWARQIRGELQKTTISLRAIIEERRITLGEVTEFKVGQVLQLQASPHSRVKLEGSEQPLFWCELGQADGVYNLRINEVFDHEQEFMNDLLSR